MPLSPGARLGPYEIVAPLGAGGMGEVYRARDPRIGREVALKVLPAEFSKSEDRLRRFEQEVRAAGALNHPNVLTIFDVGACDGSPYIVSELLEGETLRDRMNSAALAPRRAVDYALQLARGLAAAHAKGIVHRDLKPANIFLTRDGRLKILDFGLAKLTQQAGSDSDDASTQTATDPGVVLGTVGYMSPEQVRGQTSDHRSDIFSFGAVLYEMLSGRRAFHRETAVETMAAILKEDPPDLPGSTPGMPAGLERIVHRCLEKEPEQRFHSAHDLAFALEAVSGSSGSLVSGVAAVKPSAAVTGRWVRVAAFAAIAVLLAAGGWWLGRRAAPRGLPYWTVRQLTSDEGYTAGGALSPDGKLVAYTSDRAGTGTQDLWIQQTAGGPPVRMTSGPFSAYDPAFSPDGSKVIFVSSERPRGLYIIPALGGEPRRLADAPLALSPRFSPDGRWISAELLQNQAAVFLLIPSAGGEPVFLDPKMGNITSEGIKSYVWSPDSKGLLLVGGSSYQWADWDLWFLSLDGARTPFRAGPGMRAAGFGRPNLKAWDAGWLYFNFQRKGTPDLWRTSLTPGARQLGNLDPVTSGWANRNTDAVGDGGTRLVYSDSSASRRHIWSLKIDPSQGVASGEPQRMIPGERAEEYPVAVPPNRLVYWANEGGQGNLWLRDVNSGRETQLTDSPEINIFPVGSHDGSMVAFRATTPKGYVAYVVQAAGGAPHKICSNCGRVTDWSPDGKKVILHDFGGTTAGRVGLVDLQSGQQRVLMESATRIYSPRVSPDGRWLAFRAGKAFVAPYREDRIVSESEWIPLDLGAQGGDFFQWTPGARRLFFLVTEGAYRSIWTVPLDPATGKSTGPPTLVFRPQGSHVLAGDQSEIGLALLGDRLYFSMADLHANIGIAEIDAAAK
jgi:Tol biopolymer transport system component